MGGTRQIIKVKCGTGKGKPRIRYHRFIFSLARGRHSNNVWCGQWAVGSSKQPAAVKGETGTGVYFWQPAKFSLSSSPHLRSREGRKDQGRRQGGV